MTRRVLVVGTSVILIIALAAGGAQSVHALRLRDYRGVEPVCRVETARRAVGLTLDDGPDPRYTGEVLDLLATNGAHATFFVVGERAAAEEPLLDAILAGGNELGNHTWSHLRLSELTESAALGQVERTEVLLAPFGAASLVRAPYGEVRAETLADLRVEGFVPVQWSIALDRYVDGSDLPPAQIAEQIADAVRPGDIILAHDAADGPIARGAAIETIRSLLPLLEARGFEVTTVGDLMADGKPVMAIPRPWLWQSGFSCPSAPREPASSEVAP